MEKINVMSLFDGIACGYQALKEADIDVAVYYASEIDKNAIKIAKKNHPDIIELGDINDINFNDFIGKVDLIMGGSPCQDLSIAGKREGLSGDRSGLFYNFIEAIETIKPKYFLLENNVGMPKEAYEEISRLMGCYPIEINSALLSAQNRRRFYWTNIGPQQFNLFGFPTCDIPQPKDKKIILKDILESGYPVQVENFGKTINFTQTKSCSLCARDWKGFGNQQMTAVLEPLKVGYIGNVDAQANRVYSVNGKSVCLNANGGGGGAKTGLYKIDLPDGKYYIRKLTPIECERLQTLPDNYTKGIADSNRYKCIGNGWTVAVIAYIFSYLKEGAEND